MNETYIDSESLPLLFWVCLLGLLALAAYAIHQRQKPWAMPCLAVVGMAFFWYLGDVLYTGIGSISSLFSLYVINQALLQFVLFIVAYGLMVGGVARWFTVGLVDAGSKEERLAIMEREVSQRRITTSLWFVIGVWICLVLMAQTLERFPVLPFLFPPLAGHKVNPWSRGRLGEATDFLLSAGYFMHLFVCATFGSLFILARRQYPRILAGFMMLLTWPFWLFGSRRNPMLAMGIPLVVGYLLFSRQSKVIKIIAVVMLFLSVSFWFKLVLGARTDEGVTEVVVAVIQGEETAGVVSAKRHLGLDMFKELCYMNTFIDSGRFDVTWGRDYFNQALNFIPRRFWRDKPLLGYEFSRARGFRQLSGTALVECVITPGTVGQGVGNFGFFFGPIAAAFLMALWSGLLARFWLQRESVLRTSLFLLGLGLTFNAGREISLHVFFPFIFGFMLVRVYEIYEKHHFAIIPQDS